MADPLKFNWIKKYIISSKYKTYEVFINSYEQPILNNTRCINIYY